MLSQLQQLQVLDHIFLADLGAQQMVDLLGLQGKLLGLGNIVDDIDDTVHDIAGLQHFHQLASALHSGNGHHGIQILLELAGGFGTHTQSQSGLADGGAVEVGGFEDHSGGVVYDFGILTAHNACQADGALIISDDDDEYRPGAKALDQLQVGMVYVIRFSRTAGAAGEQNRDAVADAMQLTGSAILNDLNITAQNADVAKGQAKFTGSGDLTPYTPPTE